MAEERRKKKIIKKQKNNNITVWRLSCKVKKRLFYFLAAPTPLSAVGVFLLFEEVFRALGGNRTPISPLGRDSSIH
jgi:hypothetical protein